MAAASGDGNGRGAGGKAVVPRRPLWQVGGLVRAYWAMLLAGFRMLVVDLADSTATLVPGPDWAGAEVVRAEGHRRWIRFAREEISAAQLVGLILADQQVLDLSIVEPDVEDVIRRIYRGEIPPAGPARK
jgi:hypothetical protein